MIKIEDLHFKYPEDDFSLKINNFEMNDAESIALIGASGSGKSTFMKILSGEIIPLKGRITVLDQDLTALGDSQKRHLRLNSIGMVLQDSALLDYLSLLDNITLPLTLLNKKFDKEWLNTITKNCGTSELLKKKPEHVSEGEKQRAAVCRALLNKPGILLADEPTSSLDKKNSLAVTELLIKQCKENNTNLIMITHDESQLNFFDRVVNLEELNEAKS